MHLSRFTLFLSSICLASLVSSPHTLVAQDPTPRPTFVNERSDLNQDNVVDDEDLLIFMQDWGKVTGPEQIITIDIPNLPAGARPLRLVRIPAGTFQMGSPDTERGRSPYEGPVHTVNIGYDFYMGETEVTQAQWKALMGSNPATDLGYTQYGVGNDYPVYYVSWNDISQSNGFLDRLDALGQGTFRLPSEAEWEYACRAGTTTRFSFGDNLACDDSCGSCSLASQHMWWCGTNTTQTSRPVAAKLPNAFGLFDMHGNAYEWCQDYWHESYVGAPTNGAPFLIPGSQYRVLRGGNWNFLASGCRSAYRDWFNPAFRNYAIGVRVVLPASSKSF